MPMIYAFERGRNDVDSVYLLAGYCNGSGINDKFYNVFFFSSLALFIILHGILYLVWELFSVIVPELELKCQAWVKIPLYTSIICALSL